jgi:hypothetical protein
MTLSFMSILLVTSLGVTGAAMENMRRADRERKGMVAFHAAQAGLELEIARAFASMQQTNGVFVSATTPLNGVLQNVQSASATVAPLSSNPQFAWVTCTTTYKGQTRSVRGLVSSKNIGIWNNAIFAGTGASGQAINGNVDIRGSVHILGDGEAYADLNGNGKYDPPEPFTDLNKNGVWDPGEPFTDLNGDGVRNPGEPFNDSNGNGTYDPPIAQTELNSDFGGTAYIGNNYSGMPLGLRSIVPIAPKVNGIETLGTELRVKHGKVGVSGNAKIGANSVVDGGLSKAKIDGSYVSDGFTGNQGANSVFSDNGTSNSYDLGHHGIKFPLLSGIGAEQYKDSSGTVWQDQETFLNNRSLSVNLNAITEDTPSAVFGPDAFGNSLTIVKGSGSTPSVITVTGIVRVNGDLQIGAKKDTIHYKGNGTLYATGDINLSSNFLPAPGFIFPTTARVGLIAKKNMGLATGNGDSQLSMAGAFYAQGKITSAKQNQIAGTFVANFYDMGTNVPNIYQVPALAYNMPPGMPGDKTMFTLKTHTWRERKATN